MRMDPVMASNLEAWKLEAMASNLRPIASNLQAMASVDHFAKTSLRRLAVLLAPLFACYAKTHFL